MATPSAADLQAQAKIMGELIAKQKELNKLQGKSEGTAKKITKQYDVEYNTLKDTNEILKRMGKSGFTVEKIINYSKAVKSVQADLSKVEKEIDKLGKVDPYNEIKYKTYLKALEKQEKAQKRLNKLNEAASHQINYKEQANGIKKTGSALHRARGVVGNFRDELKNAFSGRDIEGAGERLTEYGKQWAGVGNAMSKMKGITGLVGKSMKSLGGLAGGIGTKLAGPAGAIYGIVKQVWDYGMSVDQFVKDVNKQFVSIRGPNIMTEDVKKQFKEFNNSLYRTIDNIRSGLNAEQVRGFMNSIIQTGVHLDRLNTGFKTYRDAVYIAAKASATLGVELPTVGNMMGKMMIDMRMNIDSIDKTFVQAAFDAQRAGLSTDRFFTAVENASASLAFYGIFIDKASRNMSSFVRSSVQGADEAAKTVTDLTQAFKGMSLEQRSAFASFAAQSSQGSKIMRDSFDTLKSQAAERIQGIDFEIRAKKASGGSADDVGKLMAERNRLAEQSLRYDRAMSNIDKKNYVALSQDLPMISGDILKTMGPLIKSTLQLEDIASMSGEQEIQLKKIFEANGLSPELAEKLVAEVRAQKVAVLSDIQMGTKDAMKLSKTFEDMKVNQESANNYLDVIRSAQGDPKRADEVASNTSKLMGLFEKANLDQNLQNLFRKMLLIDTTGRATELMKKLVKDGMRPEDIEGLKAELTNIAGSSKFIEDGVFNAADIQEKGQDDLSKRAKDTFDSIRDQTLSYNEMVDIAKNEVEWRLKSLGIFQALNTGVFNILKFLLKSKGQKTPEVRNAEQQLKAQKINIKDAEMNGQYLMQQAKLMQETKERMISEGDMQKIYEDALKSPNAVSSLEKSKARVEEQGRDAFEKGNLEAVAVFNEMSDKLSKNIEEAKSNDPTMILSKNLDESKKNTMLLQDQNQVAQDNYQNLVTIRKYADDTGYFEEINKDIISLASKNEGNMEAVGKSIDKQIKSGGDLGAWAKERDAGSGQMTKALSAYKKSIGEKGDLSETENKKMLEADSYRKVFAPIPGNENQFEGTSLPLVNGAIPAKANLRTPEMITSPGVVRLDPGEIILPDQRRAPLIGNSPVGGAQTMGGGGSKNITINVNATERDLASRIANEIRSVLYQERLTGMA